MGYTSYHASYYKKGTVDREAECRSILEQCKARVIKMAMKGKVCYAALEINEEQERKVIGVVITTSVDTKDYYNFAYKIVEESCGPCDRECPPSILRLLTPTESQFAKEWRAACWHNAVNAKAEKADPNNLNNLPIGTTIQIEFKGEKRLLYKREYRKPRVIWTDGTYRYSNNLIRNCGYTVVQGD